jgi:hypothetical protein
MSDTADLLLDVVSECLKLWDSLEFRENLLSLLGLPQSTSIIEAKKAIVEKWDSQEFRGAICFLIGKTYDTGTKR